MLSMVIGLRLIPLADDGGNETKIFTQGRDEEACGCKRKSRRSTAPPSAATKPAFPYKLSKDAASRKTSKNNTEVVQNEWATFIEVAESMRQMGTCTVQPYRRKMTLR